MMCNHAAEDHPISYGTVPASSPCGKCDCPGYIAHRDEHYRELEPDHMERFGPCTPESMHRVLLSEGSRSFGGEATWFMQFDDHPIYGEGTGEMLVRGVEPGEVPRSMRHMMRVTRGGNLMMRLRGKLNGS